MTAADQHDTRGHRVAEQLAMDARAQEARMLPETGPLSDEQLAWAAAEFTAYIETRGLEAADVARQLGDPIIAVRAFCDGNYRRGGTHQIARKLVRWVTQQRDADRNGPGGTYVSTEVAEKMIAVIRATCDVGMMGVIVGPSGISKTVVCRAVEAGIIPGSVHIELTRPHGRPAALARLIAKRIGARCTTGSLALRMEGLIDELRGSRRPLLFDEAHYLNRDGCQVVRDLHKQTGCPVVLVGTRDVLDTINDFNEFTGQFKRLFAYTLNINEELAETGSPLYSVPEVVKFAKSMGLRLTRDGAAAAAELASLPGWGGLGALRSLLLNAKALAEHAGEEQIDAKLLNISLRQMEGATGFERVRTRAKLRTQKVAVA